MIFGVFLIILRLYIYTSIEIRYYRVEACVQLKLEKQSCVHMFILIDFFISYILLLVHSFFHLVFSFVHSFICSSIRYSFTIHLLIYIYFNWTHSNVFLWKLGRQLLLPSGEANQLSLPVDCSGCVTGGSAVVIMGCAHILADSFCSFFFIFFLITFGIFLCIFCPSISYFVQSIHSFSFSYFL